MEKQRKRMTACLVLAVIIIAIAAMVLMDIAATKITGVQLDVPDTIECSDTYTIIPEFSYAQRAPSEKRLEKELERLGMHYSSDDDMVLTVDEKGTIHAVGVGTAHITYADKNEKLVATKAISVIISPKELTMPDTVRLTPGMVEQLNPSIEPANATYTDIQYISGDTAVAAVDVTGKIKGLEKGETVVTAKIKGTDIAAKTTVIVQPQIEKIEIKNGTIRTKDGDTEQILYSIVPEDAFIDGISFQSENPEVATIDENGTLTAVASGSTTITVTAGDVSATCKVIVQQNMKAESPMPGRIVIPELNINTGLTYGCTQEITDAADSAAIWETGQGITVADHWNQGNYTNIQYSIPGSTIAYIDGTKYICTECFKGYNTGTCITDNAGNDVMNTLGAGKALLYTCNGCWQNVHVAIYQVAAS